MKRFMSVCCFSMSVLLAEMIPAQIAKDRAQLALIMALVAGWNVTNGIALIIECSRKSKEGAR